MTPPETDALPQQKSSLDIKRDMRRQEQIENFLTLLFWVPALSVVVYLRHSLGYRMIRPLYFLPAFAAMIALSILAWGVGYALNNIPANPFMPQAAATSRAEQAAAQVAARRAAEISPNAGQISTPESDPAAYGNAPAGYRYHRDPDGAFARAPDGQGVLELIPKEPTIIPPESGVAGATLSGLSFLSRIPALVLFAVPMLGLCIYHRRRGWRLIFTREWHSKSSGIPHLARVIPYFTEQTIQRRIEPVFVALLGVVLLYYFSSILFGLWLVFAGMTLALAEQLIYERRINDLLDRHDARVESRWAREQDAVVKSGGRVPKQSDTGGVLVTVAPELEELLKPTEDEARRAEIQMRMDGINAELVRRGIDPQAFERMTPEEIKALDTRR